MAGLPHAWTPGLSTGRKAKNTATATDTTDTTSSTRPMLHSVDRRAVGAVMATLTLPSAGDQPVVGVLDVLGLGTGMGESSNHELSHPAGALTGLHRAGVPPGIWAT